jgi:hypothetical protein
MVGVEVGEIEIATQPASADPESTARDEALRKAGRKKQRRSESKGQVGFEPILFATTGARGVQRADLARQVAQPPTKATTAKKMRLTTSQMVLQVATRSSSGRS